MKFLIAFLFVWSGLQAFAQDVFPLKIRDFSEKYEALISQTEKDTLIKGSYEDVVPQYLIQIFDKASQKVVLEAYTADFPEYLLDENKEAIPNIKELPYGSQSVLMYEDYNFDGIKDFALMNGNGSCYGGPSFDIYLAKGGGFKYSDAFSALSNEYCGMFQVDEKTKTIYTMTKSGCCWHQFSEFKVVNNEPKPVKVTEEAYQGYTNFLEITEITYNGDKENRTVTLYFPMEEISSRILLSFELEKNGKRAILYETDQELHYAFIQKDESVEFHFPGDAENTGFVYDRNDRTLMFTNKSAQYQVYETDKTVGIKVTTNGKNYEMRGVKKTAIGSLNKLGNIEWQNVVYKTK